MCRGRRVGIGRSIPVGGGGHRWPASDRGCPRPWSRDGGYLFPVGPDRYLVVSRFPRADRGRDSLRQTDRECGPEEGGDCSTGTTAQSHSKTFPGTTPRVRSSSVSPLATDGSQPRSAGPAADLGTGPLAILPHSLPETPPRCCPRHWVNGRQARGAEGLPGTCAVASIDAPFGLLSLGGLLPSRARLLFAGRNRIAHFRTATQAETTTIRHVGSPAAAFRFLRPAGFPWHTVRPAANQPWEPTTAAAYPRRTTTSRRSSRLAVSASLPLQPPSTPPELFFALPCNIPVLSLHNADRDDDL